MKWVVSMADELAEQWVFCWAERWAAAMADEKAVWWVPWKAAP